MTGETHENRTVLRISGADRTEFLQNLVTNDVKKGGLVYAALLTPQGKFLADFFILDTGDAYLLDTHADAAPGLAQRLNMYMLRSDVLIEPAELYAIRGTGDVPEDGHPDPRDPNLGWRAYRDAPGEPSETDWDALRVAACVPEAPADITPDTFILEAGFERMRGVDFKKGCYVGQEVTARMKHKTELRKGYTKVTLDGPAEPGTEIVTEDGKPAGTLLTRAGDTAIAYLRFDRAKGALRAGDAQVTWAG
ncbi:YgfZ/GcvT domain-containing protein [Maritimibacter dapengensis]|uniref:Folate-binding protein n=1 Tax=Maritimibacter dapengensis TaxID=2836868 RepID=A0ABS6SZM0_9RHOB|nr:folate-binding protein [Maritimibacter dapengensis]MBV7377973.1 folate-binding protein [Maritimibacter dapengensis]